MAIASLNHPNIVALKGVITSFGESNISALNVGFGFLLEFCENGSVFTNLFKKGTLQKLSTRMAISCQVASGLAYMHQNSFIHQDLNTQNVVLTRDMTAKICDFGSAMQLDCSGYVVPEMIEGSPSSMSPEQLTGGKLSIQSDVWQMGVFLWEVFSMQQPWAGICDINDLDSMTELIVKRRARLPPLSAATFQGRLGEISSTIQKCFVHQADLRPRMSDVHALLQELYNDLFALDSDR
jgi:serine/threonine protein kinase